MSRLLATAALAFSLMLTGGGVRPVSCAVEMAA